MTSALAPGWTLTEDEGGPLLRAPVGAVRLDRLVADVLSGDGRGTSRVFREGVEAVAARLGALADRPSVEPPHPAPPERGPLVSVVVANADGRDLLETCLRSLRAQAYAPLEVVLVDGGSTDGSVEAAQRIMSDLVVVRVPRGTGFAAANNAGVAAARGRLLFLLNNDTELEPDTVGQLVRVATARPRRLAAVGAMTRRGDLAAVVESLGNVVGMGGFGAGRHAGHVDLGQFVLEEDAPLFSAAFTAVLIPRAAWETVGPLDERFGFYYEDVEWSLRGRTAGFQIWPAPHAVVRHRGSASIGSRPSTYKERLVRRNRLLWAAKGLRMRAAVGFTRRYAAEDARVLADALRRGDRDAASVVLGAWAGAAAQLPDLWRARQAARRWHLVGPEALFRAAAVGPPLMDGPYPLLDERAMREAYLWAVGAAARAR